MDKIINGVQCREARMLLRWNVKDLAYRSNVDVRRIRAFEGLHEPLYYEEMRAILEVFKQEYIIFTNDAVTLNLEAKHSYLKDAEEVHKARHGNQYQHPNPKADEVLARLLGKTPSP